MIDLGKLSYELVTNDYILIQKVISQTGAVEKPYLYRVQQVSFGDIPEISAFLIENGEEGENEILSGFYDEYVAMVLGHWKHSPSYIELSEAEKQSIKRKNLNDREVRDLIKELQTQE